jgi:hypothetical protein
VSFRRVHRQRAWLPRVLHPFLRVLLPLTLGHQRVRHRVPPLVELQPRPASVANTVAIAHAFWAFLVAIGFGLGLAAF